MLTSHPEEDYRAREVFRLAYCPFGPCGSAVSGGLLCQKALLTDLEQLRHRLFGDSGGSCVLLLAECSDQVVAAEVASVERG